MRLAKVETNLIVTETGTGRETIVTEIAIETENVSVIHDNLLLKPK
jgi:hypothetical protein